jgi:hypothetical protein
VSTFAAIKQAASRFCPPYEVKESAPSFLRVRLHDPTGNRPDLVLRHQNHRRLFLKANYLLLESSVPGHGPSADGELLFRFWGPLRRQRGSVRWRESIPDGDEWIARLEAALLTGARNVEAIQSLRISWSRAKEQWRLRMETMSGSVVSGLGAPLPIAVPLDPREAEGIIGMIDALAATAR